MHKKVVKRVLRARKQKKIIQLDHTEAGVVPTNYKPVVSVDAYRLLTGDTITPELLVTRRLWCLEKLCRGVIISELRNYE